MYNRYIPQEADYAPIPPSQSAGHGPQPTAPSQAKQGGGLGGLLSGLLRGERGNGAAGKVSQTLSSILKSVGLKDLDTGDILLALIVLLLILEDGDDLELLIALGLMILLNLGEP